jgi:hypothetical protein
MCENKQTDCFLMYVRLTAATRSIFLAKITMLALREALYRCPNITKTVHIRVANVVPVVILPLAAAQTGGLLIAQVEELIVTVDTEVVVGAGMKVEVSVGNIIQAVVLNIRPIIGQVAAVSTVVPWEVTVRILVAFSISV